MGGLGQGDVINIWPVKPFGTVMVINGYANNIESNLIMYWITIVVINNFAIPYLENV